MADILRFPSRRPLLTLAVDNTAPQIDIHQQRRLDELHRTRSYLYAAMLHIDSEIHEICAPQAGIRAAAPCVKAALFHTLTLDGCREKDRALRNMLAAEDEDLADEAVR